MFADASSFAATTRLQGTVPRALRQVPIVCNGAERAVLGPRRLAHLQQRAGLAAQRVALVGLMPCLPGPSSRRGFAPGISGMPPRS